jgi:hypothetical protein
MATARRRRCVVGLVHGPHAVTFASGRFWARRALSRRQQCNTSICGRHRRCGGRRGAPITSLSKPRSRPAAETKLIVNGANLARDSVVKWNGSNRVIYLINSAQITATIRL